MSQTYQLKPSSPATTASGPVAPSTHGMLRPLPLGSMDFSESSFLGAWQMRSGEATIAHCIENLESSGVLDNFRYAAGDASGPSKGMLFADSDLYKTLEAVGWESGRRRQPVYQVFLELSLDLIERAQEPDGYLNTNIQNDPTKRRWANLIWSHELYCAGHLFQAAVALSRGAGDRRLLTVANRFADRIISDLEDQPGAFDGHAEVETAMVELARETGHSRYLDFAATQIHRRGHGLLPKHPFGPEYFGDHETVENATEVTGHAVRQLYFAAGVTDVYLEQGDATLFSAVERLWNSAFQTKTYITGGHGSRHAGEAFGDPYELPPDRAYAETCAAIASFQWNWRMLLASGDAKYADAMENVLYNTIAASVSLDGKHFFYTNPLQMRTGHRGETDDSPTERLSWFECACCPPNLARLLASLQTYTVTQSNSGIQLHLLQEGLLTAVHDGATVKIDVNSGSPWDGSTRLKISGPATCEIAIRMPAWATESSVIVDGTLVLIDADSYARVTRDWSKGVVIDIETPITPAFTRSHARVDANRGTVAIRRGPFIYCIESIDQRGGSTLEDLRIDPDAEFRELPGSEHGVEVALSIGGCVTRPDSSLYSDDPGGDEILETVTLTAIPYYSWGNRGNSAMRVWIPSATREGQK